MASQENSLKTGPAMRPLIVVVSAPSFALLTALYSVSAALYLQGKVGIVQSRNLSLLALLPPYDYVRRTEYS